MRKAQYICFEGTEGVGKTTQTQKLADYLRAKGYRVLQTKEPGSPLSPLTMTLRGLMLDRQYEAEMTPVAREFLSQAIRSIHMDCVVYPALKDYDFIIQDRGILSGLAYGTGCGHNTDFLMSLSEAATHEVNTGSLYDAVVYLRGDVKSGLTKALSSKQEFAAGDAMEAKGVGFLNSVSAHMNELSNLFNTVQVNVDGKSIDQVFDEILGRLQLKE